MIKCTGWLKICMVHSVVSSLLEHIILAATTSLPTWNIFAIFGDGRKDESQGFMRSTGTCILYCGFILYRILERIFFDQTLILTEYTCHSFSVINFLVSHQFAQFVEY